MPFNNAPIGIFDSGLGGLTVVKAVKENMPYENIVYLGDSLNVPYGDKSPAQIREFAKKNADFLISQGVKAIAVACNTVDSVALSELTDYCSVPVVGVVAPASLKASQITKNNRVGVLATFTAVKSTAYEKSIRGFNENIEVFSLPAPLLVPLVEEGKINCTDKETVGALSEYLCELQKNDIDTLVLGCTHYPLLLDIVKEIAPCLNVVCSGYSSLGSLRRLLEDNSLLNEEAEKGCARYFVTGTPTYFEKHGGLFLGESLEGKVIKAVL